MSGYKRVNYYELCRLCTSTESTKVHLFREEGRRRQLPTRIKRCLPLKIQEYDLLPKMICSACVTKLEEFDNFRTLCLEAEQMLCDFRTKLKTTTPESDGKLQVYVKDSPSHNIFPMKKEVPARANDQNEQTLQNSTDTGKRTITVMTVPGRANESLPCSMPLKLNGVSSSVVPVNVENLSSLIQVVPNTEMPRIQKFNVPLQTEMPTIDETNGARYNVTLRPSDSIQKDAVNVIQSLQCSVTDDKMSIQSTAAASSVSFSTTTVPVSLISTAHPTITQNDGMQEVVMQMSMSKEEHMMKSSCPHCGKILSDPNEICDHSVEPPSTDDSTINHHSVITSVIQSNPTMFNANKPTKWLYSEDNNGFKCDICEKPFRKKEHLFQHRKLHSGVRPYVCGSCGKSFSRKEHLFRHTLAHTGERQHSCNMCGKTFSRKDNLHKHRRTHGITGPYECELCGKSFIVKHYYLQHQANHSSNGNEELPFQCDICKKGFVKEEFLNTHKVRHRVRVNQRSPVVSADSVITTATQVEDDHLSTIDPVALLSPTVQQNCSDDTIYISTQTPTYTLTSTANTTTATQTPIFVTNLGTEHQLLENYRHLNSTSVST